MINSLREGAQDAGKNSEPHKPPYDPILKSHSVYVINSYWLYRTSKNLLKSNNIRIFPKKLDFSRKAIQLI